MGAIPLKGRLIGLIVLMLFTAISATSYINYKMARDSVRHELIHSGLPLTRDNIISEINVDLVPPLFVASSMASDTFLKEWAMGGEQDEARVVRYLEGIRKRYGYFTTFFVSSNTHKYYYNGGLHKQISPSNEHDVWYYSFVQSHLTYRLDVDTNEAENNVLTIFINNRVEDEAGNLLGVAGVGLELNAVSRMLKSYESKYNRRVFMVDESGVVQAHTNSALVEKESIINMDGIQSIASDILTHESKSMDYEYEGAQGKVLLSARYIPELKWFLIVEQDEQEALVVVRGNLVRNLGVGGLITLAVVIVMIFTINHFQTRLEVMATTDELTGVANRRAFEDVFARARERFERSDKPFSIVLMDLDGFKQVNDKAGHVEGDRVLKMVALAIQKAIRTTDCLARWGGDEFIVLLSGNQEQAQLMSARIKDSIDDLEYGALQQSPWDGGTLGASCGVVEYERGESLDKVTRRADEAMYVDKRARKGAMESSS